MDHRRLLNEAPTVVGILTTSLGSGGSLDTAVRTVASEGPPISAGIFGDVVRLTYTRGCDGIAQGLTEAVGRLPPGASGYKQAMLLCVSASESDGESERARLLEEASETALESVRTMGESYSSSLTVPCMTVFGLGIMVPMILMSLIPMLGIGGMFGAGTLDSRTIVLVTVVLIPAVILALSIWIRRTNPFLPQDPSKEGLLSASPLLLAIPLALFQLSQGRPFEEVVLLSVGPASVVASILMVGGHLSERRREACEQGLRDSVFELGNRMITGDSFEKVCPEVIGGRPECADVRLALERELGLCRGDVGSAVDRSIGSVSQDVSRAYRDILRCSEGDTVDAGRLAIAVGRQFQNSATVRKGLELRLRSMTDMMMGTAVLFAPMVLGMSVSMLEPLSGISGFQPMDDSGAVLSVYLVELCALISMLTCNIGGGGSLRSCLWRFCLMVPAALVVFRVCSSFGLRREGYHRKRASARREEPRPGGDRRHPDHCAACPGADCTVHGPVRDVHPPGRNTGCHRQRLDGTRTGRGGVSLGGLPVPPGMGQELHPQRVAASLLHQRRGDPGRTACRIHSLPDAGDARG